MVEMMGGWSMWLQYPCLGCCHYPFRRHEFKPSSPLLVVAPQSVLDFWDGEWQFWAAGGAEQQQQPVNVVVYSGPASVRACILEYETWLHPTSADGKGAAVRVRQREGCLAVVFVQPGLLCVMCEALKSRGMVC